jgi:hypothetical protein
MDELSVVKQNFIHYIDRIVENHKISHTYLIEIADYDLDMKYVYDFIKMILCDVSYDELSKCDNSIISFIDHNNYPDIKIIEPEGAMIKKNQLLELQKEYSNKSLLDGKRIYIIKNAEKLNVSSANTMLKFLEEPEDDIIAFLITDNRYHVLETILSRCQILTLRDDSLILESDEKTLELLKSIVNPKDFFLKYTYFVNDVLVDKATTLEVFEAVDYALIYYLNYKNGLFGKIDDNYVKILESVDEKQLLYYLSVIEKELPKLDFNVNYKLWLDSLFSRMIIGG